jgi:hypothetical protein
LLDPIECYLCLQRGPRSRSTSIRRKARRPQALPKKGPKEDAKKLTGFNAEPRIGERGNDEREDASYTVSMATSEWAERASVVRQRTLGKLSVAVWDDASRLAELVMVSGNFRETMGLRKEKKDWLYGEEALFLLEQGGVHSHPLTCLALVTVAACPGRFRYAAMDSPLFASIRKVA